MHYYKARKTVENPYVNVVLPNGTCIEPSDVQRWLGFWFDIKRSWKHHIQTRTASAMRVFMALSRLGNTERGLSQSALRQLYQSCITTVADFGTEVWWKQQKTQSLPFQRLQYQAMRKIAGAFFFLLFYLIHTACKPKAYGINRKIHAQQRKTQPLSSCAHQGHPTSPPQYIHQARLMPNIPQAVTECHQRLRGQSPSRRVSKPINLSNANHLHLVILSILFTGTFSDRALSAGG